LKLRQYAVQMVILTDCCAMIDVVTAVFVLRMFRVIHLERSASRRCWIYVFCDL